MRPTSSSIPAKILFAFLVSACALQWILSGFLGFMADAGYYLPMAREVWLGFVPYIDFNSHYPPLTYYMLAILGEGLGVPAVVRLFLFLIALACGALLFWILREEGNDRAHSTLLAALYMAWTACLGTKWVELEPFQNLFLLAGWLALIKWPSWRGVALGGIAVGAALMIKQYALLAVPGFSLLALSPGGALPWRLSGAEWRSGLLRVLVFGLWISFPFAVFVLLTGQDFLTLFQQLATLGGTVGEYSRSLSVQWLHQVQKDFMVGESSALLLPSVLMCLWWMFVRPSSRVLALGLVLVLAFLPQLVRGAPHYFALMVPWAVLVVSGFTKEMATQLAANSEGVSRQRVREWMVVFVCLAVVPLVLHGTLFTIGYVTQKRFLASSHKEVAKKIREKIPDGEDVVLVFQYHMYVVAGLQAPGHDYTWPHAFGWQKSNPKRDAARHAVLLPAREKDMQEGRAWLEAGGMELFAEIPSAWDTPVLLFRRPDARPAE